MRRLNALPYGIAMVTAVTAVRSQFLPLKTSKLPFSQFLPPFFLPHSPLSFASTGEGGSHSWMRRAVSI